MPYPVLDINQKITDLKVYVMKRGVSILGLCGIRKLQLEISLSARLANSNLLDLLCLLEKCSVPKDEMKALKVHLEVIGNPIFCKLRTS